MRETQNWSAQTINCWFIALLLGGLLIRVVLATWLHPGFDEAYYYLYTLHPDWSYFDHPPLVALTTGFGPWLTGEVSQLTIRLGTLALYTGSLVFLYLTSAKLFNSKAAIFTLAIATAIPFFQIGFGVLTLPDSPLIFFWSASLYWSACEFFDQPGQYQPSYRLAVISVLVGLACLGKYHGFILGFGLICFCLINPRHRSALTSPWTGLGLGLFLVTISPVIFWNIQHDWVSFRFQSTRAVPDTSGYSLGGLIKTFLAGIGYLFPTFGLALWGVSLRAVLDGLTPVKPFAGLSDWKFSSRWYKQLLILCVSLPVILGFTFMGGYQQILPAWPMPGFWGISLLLGQQAAIWHKRSPHWVQRWLWGSGVAIVALLFIGLLHVTAGILQKPSNHTLFGGFWPAPADTSTQLIDIQQLRRGFTDSPGLNSALQNASFVFTNPYFLGGQIAMAFAPLGQKPVTCFCEDLRGFAFWSQADQWLGKDALYVTSELFQEGENVVTQYGEYFRSIRKVGEVPIQRGGAVVQVFKVYQADTLLKPYPRPYGL
jgi:4-amino-4-deoxy-L-arabinose transferase-like glycosyltransferase